MIKSMLVASALTLPLMAGAEGIPAIDIDSIKGKQVVFAESDNVSVQKLYELNQEILKSSIEREKLLAQILLELKEQKQ